MAEQVSDHVDAAPGIGGAAPEGVPQLMRRDGRGQARPAGGGGKQIADRPRAHRRADRAAEQVHQHEVAAGGAGDGHPLQRVSVERQHHQEIQRHRALPA